MSPLIDLIGSAKGYGWGSLREPVLAFESIATITASAVDNVTFTSIPSTFKYLQIRANVISAAGAPSILMQFNGDTANNYSRHHFYSVGNNTTNYGGYATTNSINTAFVGMQTTYPNVFIMDIDNYSSTSIFKTTKTFNARNNNTAATSYISFDTGNWRSTSAISSIKIFTSGGGGYNFLSGTTFSLYGIRG